MQAFFLLVGILASREAKAERCGSGDLTWAWMQNRVQVPARCTELFLISTPIGDAGAAALAQTLPNAPHLTTLSLYDNGIGELGSRLLASALPKSRLSALTLWRNKVGNGGARALADALSHASTVLTSLDLHDTTIGPQGAAAIAQALAGGAANTAYDSREESSYESYANITVNTSAAATAGVARVEELSTPRPPPLAWLSLEGNPLGDDGAAALAWALPKSRLTELHLASCGVGDVGAAALAVALMATPAVAAVTTATSLGSSPSGVQRYGTENNGVGSSSGTSRKLSSSSGLAMLFLAQNLLSDRGALALAASLDGLLEAYLTSDAAQYHETPPLLHAMMPTMAQLLPGFLSACTESAESINHSNGICANHISPHSYSFNSSTSYDSNLTPRRRPGNSHLVALDLSGNERVSSGALAKVARLLSHGALAKRRAEMNPRCSAQDLTWWESEDSDGDADGAASKSKNSTGNATSTSSSSKVASSSSPQGMPSMNGFTLRSQVYVPLRCTSLSLLGHPLGDHGVAALSRALIRQTTRGSGTSDSTYSKSADTDLGSTSAGRSSRNAIPVYDDEASSSPLRLVELDLSGVGMGVVGVSSLADALVHTCRHSGGLCNSLKALFLSSNPIGDEGACALSRALAYPSNFNVGSSSVSSSGGWSMVLEELDLMNAQLGPLAATALSQALRIGAASWDESKQFPRGSTSTTASLDAASGTNTSSLRAPGEASESSSRSSSATYCGRMNSNSSGGGKNTPRPLPRLQVLHLHGNHLGDDGAEELANLLMREGIAAASSSVVAPETAAASETTSVLTGSAAAASLLVGNGPSNLLKLDLGMNGVGDRGGIALANALKHNTKLQSLYLDSNGLGPTTGASLVEALKSWGPNTELSALSLAGNPLMNRVSSLNEQQEQYSILSSRNEHGNSSSDSNDSNDSNDSSSGSGQEASTQSFGAAIAELLIPAAMNARQDAQCPSLASAHEATRVKLKESMVEVAALKRQLLEKDHLLMLLHDDRKLLGWLSALACTVLLVLALFAISSAHRAPTSPAVADLNAQESSGELLQDKSPLTSTAAGAVAMEDWVEKLPGLSSSGDGSCGVLPGGEMWSSSGGLGSLDLGTGSPLSSSMHIGRIGVNNCVNGSSDSAADSRGPLSSSSFDHAPSPIQRPGRASPSDGSIKASMSSSNRHSNTENSKNYAIVNEQNTEDDENDLLARHGFDALLAFDEPRANSPVGHRAASSSTSSSQSQQRSDSSATTATTNKAMKSQSKIDIPSPAASITPAPAVTSPVKLPVKPATPVATTSTPPSSKASTSGSGGGKRGGKSMHKGKSWEERCSEVGAAAASARSGGSRAADDSQGGGGWDAPATAVTTTVATTAALAALAAAKAKNEKAGTSNTNKGGGVGEKDASKGARGGGGNSGRKNRGSGAR